MTNEELFSRYRETGDISVRNEIVEKYLYMVDILVKKYLNKGAEYDDLYQVGALALVMAVDRFEPDKGFEFTSFATPTILGEIKKYFRDKMWAVRVPRRMKELSQKISRERERFAAEHGREPSVDELAAASGETREDVLGAIESARAYEANSLDSTYDDIGEDGGNAILDRYAATEEHGYARVENYEIIMSVFDSLSDTDKRIFELRFREGKSQSEVAEILGVSQMTISRAERAMKEKSRAELRK